MMKSALRAVERPLIRPSMPVRPRPVRVRKSSQLMSACVAVDGGRVLSLMSLTLVDDLAEVDGVREHFVDMAAGEELSALAFVALTFM